MADYYPRKHYKPTRWDVLGPGRQLVKSFATFAEAYTRANLLNAGGTSEVSIAPVARPADADEASVAAILKQAASETRDVARAERAGERIDDETMEFRMTAKEGPDR